MTGKIEYRSKVSTNIDKLSRVSELSIRKDTKPIGKIIRVLRKDNCQSGKVVMSYRNDRKQCRKDKSYYRKDSYSIGLMPN